MLQRYLLVWLILLSAAAILWDKILPDTFHPFHESKPYLSYLFTATMFVIGSLLPPDEVRAVVRRWIAAVVPVRWARRACPG